MTNEKQKKEAVFAAIAELESQGRRINADLVAKHATMGKQTVLPFYNEWRYLKKMEVYNQEDLPEALMRAIKQHMGKWKYEYEHQYLENIEEFNQNIIEIEDKLNDSVANNKKLDTQLKNKDTQIQQQDELIKTIKNDLQNFKSTIVELNTKLRIEQEQNKKAEADLVEQKRNHSLQLQEQEKKLDNHYQQHLDHWIKTTDYEKQERNKIEKKLSNKIEDAEKSQITNLNLTNKLNNAEARLTDSESINQEKTQKIIELTNSNNYLKQITLLLDCPITELVTKIRQLFKGEIELKHCQANNINLLKQIEKSQKTKNIKKTIQYN